MLVIILSVHHLDNIFFVQLCEIHSNLCLDDESIPGRNEYELVKKLLLSMLSNTFICGAVGKMITSLGLKPLIWDNVVFTE